MLKPEAVAVLALDDGRLFRERMPGRAAAVRGLPRRGPAAAACLGRESPN